MRPLGGLFERGAGKLQTGLQDQQDFGDDVASPIPSILSILSSPSRAKASAARAEGNLGQDQLDQLDFGEELGSPDPVDPI